MNAHPVRRIVHVVLLTFLIIGTASCGTVIYPERRGQKTGRVDAGIAVLDAVGLLFFLVPGVVAFAVDFSTGAIYLPSDSSATDDPDLYVLKRPTATLDMLSHASLEAFLEVHTGRHVDLCGAWVSKVGPQGVTGWQHLSEMLTPSQLAAFGGPNGSGVGPVIARGSVGRMRSAGAES